MADLFSRTETTFENLETDIKSICNDVVSECTLPERGVWYDRTISNAQGIRGQLISYSVFVNEPAYPATDEDMKDENRTHVLLMTIQRIAKGGIEQVSIDVPLKFAATVTLPADVGTRERPNGLLEIRIPLASGFFPEFVKALIVWKLKYYVTSASSFGCCSLHVKCSDARKCVHSNRLYSTACAYRQNLEAGRIFYGKNRNVGEVE